MHNFARFEGKLHGSSSLPHDNFNLSTSLEPEAAFFIHLFFLVHRSDLEVLLIHNQTILIVNKLFYHYISSKNVNVL